MYGISPESTQMVTAFTCTAIVHNDNPIDSRFSLLLNDFSEEDGWHQVVQTDLAQMRATLKALARMHAFFWLGNKITSLASCLFRTRSGLRTSDRSSARVCRLGGPGSPVEERA